MRNLNGHKAALDGNDGHCPGSQDAGVRQLILRRLSLDLRIAERTIQFLGEDGFNGSDLPEGNFAAEKPLAETAMLLYVARRQKSDPELQSAFDKLLQNLIPHARSRQMRWDVLRYPSVYLQLATPHILFGSLHHQPSHSHALPSY